MTDFLKNRTVNFVYANLLYSHSSPAPSSFETNSIVVLGGGRIGEELPQSPRPRELSLFDLHGSSQASFRGFIWPDSEITQWWKSYPWVSVENNQQSLFNMATACSSDTSGGKQEVGQKLKAVRLWVRDRRGFEKLWYIPGALEDQCGYPGKTWGGPHSLFWLTLRLCRSRKVMVETAL